MARGKCLEEKPLSPEEQREQSLMYREDLAEAIGIIAHPPTHRVDETGRVIWGEFDAGITSSPEVVREFREAVEAIIEDVVAEVAPEIALDRTLPSHIYQQQPAAQAVVEIAYMLWEHKEVFAVSLGFLVDAGTIVTAVTQKARAWVRNRQALGAETTEDRPTDSTPWRIGGGTPEPIIVWTQGAAAAAVVSDAYSRYGLSERCEIRVFPRGNAYSGGPTHPDKYISYLVRIQDGPRVLVYHVRSEGRVDEHYQLAGDRITPLPLPNLTNEEQVPTASYPGLTLSLPKKTALE